MHKNLMLAICMVTAVTGFAQTRLVEKVARKGDEIIIPYEKYVLPNGLTYFS